MPKIEVVCENCGTKFLRRKADVNRSKQRGRRTFCSLRCSGLGSGIDVLKHIDLRIQRENQENIKNYAGNRRDEFSTFRYFLHLVRLRTAESKKGLAYDIGLRDLKDQWEKQQGTCPYTGWKLRLPLCTTGFENNCKQINNASLDRIDSSRGYVKGNIQFVSYMSNMAKNDFSDEDMKKFCGAIAEKWKK